MTLGEELDKIANKEYTVPLEDEPIPMSIWEVGFAKELAKQVAAAEARGRQQMIDALRDGARYQAWWEPRALAKAAGGDGYLYLLSGRDLTAAADYLEAIAKEKETIE